ncbi:hypothetical protein CONCODRAFT_11723 [Conidiobolus coronatus NRRL 28638]|uniref:G-protein coupled receptors family 1 profile domain-containing protein n=1 Tax=Conidiobolus coronatus (strain ATCC 28846 / CBS 209.66 / NRRL 28638) TaxID=796925 RepID=A0A137NUF6_CONC2|nr:hypothetical protein CONCODRAFT_11723 [Conidiobolus coronatus NRRL 28638]|eukprot:KXN66433.1 hypothetical protein CONCODRAFT_11723 [Conidiobolus coronatus NRRL 28638]
MVDYNEVRSNAYPYNYILDSIGLALAIPGLILSVSVLRVLLTRRWAGMNIDLKLIIFTLIFDIISCLESGLNCFFNMINFKYNLSMWWSCNLAATICLIGFITSINLVGIIAFERCLLICYHKTIKDHYYWIFLGGCITMNAVCITIGWTYNGFTILPASMYCMFNVATTGGKVCSLLTLFSALISMSVVFAGYIQIALKRANQSKRDQLELGMKADKVNRNVRSTIAKSMIIVLVCCMNNGPYCILVIISLINNDFLTPLIDCISASCLMLNLCLNTIIVLHMRPFLINEVLTSLGINRYSFINSRWDEDNNEHSDTN